MKDGDVVGQCILHRATDGRGYEAAVENRYKAGSHRVSNPPVITSLFSDVVTLKYVNSASVPGDSNIIGRLSLLSEPSLSFKLDLYCKYHTLARVHFYRLFQFGWRRNSTGRPNALGPPERLGGTTLSHHALLIALGAQM